MTLICQFHGSAFSSIKISMRADGQVADQVAFDIFGIEDTRVDPFQRRDEQKTLCRHEACPHETCPRPHRSLSPCRRGRGQAPGDSVGWVGRRRWSLLDTLLSFEAEALFEQPYLRIRLGFGESFSKSNIDQRSQEGPP